MRKRMAFQPTQLDGLESRVVLSAVGVVSAEVAHVATHHEHTPKVEHHGEHQPHHVVNSTK
jgi:hypothetical protein